MMAIYHRELRRCFGGVYGYIAVFALLLLSGVFTFLSHFVSGMTDFSLVILRMRWGLVIAIPLLSMQSFARERREGTERMLFSMPITPMGLLMGKFCALATVFLLPTALTALYPLILGSITEIPLATAYGALVGYLLLGLALLSTGMLISSLFRHEAAAGAVTLILSVLLHLLPTLTRRLPAWLGDPLWMLDPMARLSGFAYGYFDLTCVFFYLSWTAVSLLLTWMLLRSRQWGEEVSA